MTKTEQEQIDALVIQYNAFREEFIEKEDAALIEFDLSNKLLRECITGHIKLQHSWMRFSREIEKYAHRLEAKCDSVYGKCMIYIKKTSPISYSATEIKHAVEAQTNYIEFRHQYDNYKNLSDRCKDIVKVIDQRYWSLKEIANLAIHGQDNYII